MDDAGRMCAGERLADLQSEVADPRPWQTPSAGHGGGQVLSLQPLHRVEAGAVGQGPEVQHLDDVAVALAELRRDPRLAQESLAGRGAVAEFSAQHLDGATAAEKDLLGDVDRAHATFAEAREEPVAPLEFGADEVSPAVHLPPTIAQGSRRSHCIGLVISWRGVLLAFSRSPRGVTVCLVAALALASPTIRAAPSIESADAEGERFRREAKEATQPREAAELLRMAVDRWVSILAANPEGLDHQVLREQAYCYATEDLLRANELAPDPALVDRGAELSREYLAELERVYAAKRPSPNFCIPEERAAEFARLRPTSVEKPGSAPPVDPLPNGPAVSGPPPRRWPVIGMWSALGVTVGFGAAALGTSLALRHDPDDPTNASKQGPVYKDLQAAIVDHPELNQRSNNLCAREVRSQDVDLVGPCRTYDAWIASTVLFAAAAVTTAAFLGVVLRDRARGRRGERPSFAASPTRGGAFVQLRLRF